MLRSSPDSCSKRFKKCLVCGVWNPWSNLIFCSELMTTKMMIKRISLTKNRLPSMHWIKRHEHQNAGNYQKKKDSQCLPSLLKPAPGFKESDTATLGFTPCNVWSRWSHRTNHLPRHTRLHKDGPASPNFILALASKKPSQDTENLPHCPHQPFGPLWCHWGPRIHDGCNVEYRLLMHLWVAVPSVGLAVIQNQSVIPQSVNRYVPLQQLIITKERCFCCKSSCLCFTFYKYWISNQMLSGRAWRILNC